MDKFRLMPGGNHESRAAHGPSATTTTPGVHEETFSHHIPSRPATAMDAEREHHPPRTPRSKPHKIVLCFDGTGNKFHGDDSDSNILKIYRMLDRTASDQYHYYQPGIGTYVVSNSLSRTGSVARMKSWYLKAKDSAVGSSFDHHVVGGYRFLMRFYSPGDEIYIFGFSRGAYIARFLAEMLDYVGLLSHGNEEMVSFAWKAFSNWQARQGNDGPEGERKKKEMYEFMKGFRETFSRPVRRIRFLGLFDTVNSVPRFETAWMQRSKFPYTARTSAKVIRHAVSIDERRAKFRQDLIYQSDRPKKDKGRNHAQEKLHEIHEKYRRRGSAAVKDAVKGGDRGRRTTLAVPDDPAPYRTRSHSTRRSRQTRMTEASEASEGEHAIPDGQSEYSVAPHPHTDDAESLTESSEDEHDQDIDEVWFAGGHGDIGGGWELIPGSKPASHIPLVWMVREAMRAGLTFDLDKVREMGCIEAADESDMDMTMVGAKEEEADDSRDPLDSSERPPVPGIVVRSSSMSTPKMFQGVSFQDPAYSKESDQAAVSEDSKSGEGARPLTFREMLQKAETARIHDSLKFDCGLGWGTVLSWKMMEFIPFRRMDLTEDGAWKPIRWPLPCGEVRDIPENARIHDSVIRRMKLDESYRPGNLIVGGGGRGVRIAPERYGIGEWVCVCDEGDPVGAVWVKKSAVEKAAASGLGLQ
ncbi:hypothetical protein QBC34DRAFT_456886 [Podospora aff. communis PSN243]|uniref:T6SS Phospholipase effector Tle1-like catalytic domain-containing protein n=1 Tax=Podospora aff. communis PSN243 TaxID=3040156 RepID=A0AAV9FXN0_9PEZI|nr:hypothetical protein QBC34DRAFT_456886 [Podospora aff. communis PSN243]